MKARTTQPTIGDDSPWGKIEGIVETAVEGCIFVSTPSHGGFWVADDLLHKMPKAWRQFGSFWADGMGDQWYEEDCAAIGVAAYILKDQRALEILAETEARYFFRT